MLGPGILQCVLPFGVPPRAAMHLKPNLPSLAERKIRTVGVTSRFRSMSGKKGDLSSFQLWSSRMRHRRKVGYRVEVETHRN